jgi:hypothetical protein
MDPMSRSTPVFLDLRRVHTLNAPPGGRGNKEFVVTKRMPAQTPLPAKMVKWEFGTLEEARRQWLYEGYIMEDKGMEKMDFLVQGFHEED